MLVFEEKEIIDDDDDDDEPLGRGEGAAAASAPADNDATGPASVAAVGKPRECADDDDDDDDAIVSIVVTPHRPAAPAHAHPGAITMMVLPSPSPPHSAFRGTLAFPRSLALTTTPVGPFGPLMLSSSARSSRSLEVAQLERTLEHHSSKIVSLEEDISALRHKVFELQSAQLTVLRECLPSPPRRPAPTGKREKGVTIAGPVTVAKLLAEAQRVKEAKEAKVAQVKASKKRDAEERASERKRLKQEKDVASKEAKKLRGKHQNGAPQPSPSTSQPPPRAAQPATGARDRPSHPSGAHAARLVQLPGAATPSTATPVRPTPHPPAVTPSPAPVRRQAARERRIPERLAGDFFVTFKCERDGCARNFVDKCDDCSKSVCAEHADHATH